MLEFWFGFCLCFASTMIPIITAITITNPFHVGVHHPMIVYQEEKVKLCTNAFQTALSHTIFSEF